MNTYIILLRAVNVSGSKIIKMAELRDSLARADFQDVQTYIQSGNIVLQSELSSKEVEKAIQQIIQSEFGLDISLFVLTPSQVKSALKSMPFRSDADSSRVLLTFYAKKISESVIEELEPIRSATEEIHPGDGVLYFHFPDGSGKSKLSNKAIEKVLEQPCTSRNLRTMNKLLLMAADH